MKLINDNLICTPDRKQVRHRVYDLANFQVKNLIDTGVREQVRHRGVQQVGGQIYHQVWIQVMNQVYETIER